MSWCTIESDPGVFTELVEKFGASGCEFAELYSLDDANSHNSSQYSGSYFCSGGRARRTTGPAALKFPTIFAVGVVSNGVRRKRFSGVVKQGRREGLTLGPALEELKTAADLPFDMRGLAIENAEKIRTAHNAFARPEPFE